ncbi:glycosyltransferase family 4 protein [Proteobacteria bacterium 005FR1]|nr:glycosyltransferase family 4 protein [Proteobacteria bacterium 005FR1]
MTTDTVGGVWTYTMELCAALEEYGIEIELASMGRRLSTDQAREVEQLTHVRVHESDYRLCWMDNPWDDVDRASRWLLKLERQLKPDLVQLNDFGHGNLPWQSPVVLVGHSCVYSWWEAVKKQLPEPRQWSRYRSVVRASVQRADWLVAPSKAILKSLLYYYGPAQVSMVIPNGRNYPPLAPVAGSSKPASVSGKAGADLAISEGDREPIIFAAGRIWDEAKNIASLVGIADQLPLPVYVAGETAQPGAVNGSDRDSQSGAHYLGFLNKEEMAQWLERTSIYVAPAHYEPFGLGILEAARSGCALVLGDIPSLREVWADAAEYVDPLNPDELKQAVSRLAALPSRRQYLAGRAWQRAQVYSAERMANDYVQCYRTLVHGPHAVPLTAKNIGLKHGMAGAKT